MEQRNKETSTYGWILPETLHTFHLLIEGTDGMFRADAKEEMKMLTSEDVLDLPVRRSDPYL
jgi:hypothetical protein